MTGNKYIIDSKKDIAGFYVSDTECREIDKDFLDSMVRASKKVSDSFDLHANDSADGLAKKFRDLGLVTYGLETTSDKEINGRQYSNSSVEASAADGWIKPYNKPIMEDHIIHSMWGDTATLLGRVTDSHFIRRDSGKMTKGTSDKLPNVVKNHFLKLEDKGTGISILKMDLNDKGIKSLQDGELKTFSQGSVYRKGECNICGKDYTDDECNHRMGKIYEADGKQVKCVPILSDRTPVEVSRVYRPANDTSQKVVYNSKTGKILSDEEVVDLLAGTVSNDSNNDNSNTDPLHTNDNAEGNDTTDEEGGMIIVSKALKNAVIDAAEARLEKNFTDEFIAEFNKVADEAKTDAELDLVVKFGKLFGKMDCADSLKNYPTATPNADTAADSELPGTGATTTPQTTTDTAEATVDLTGLSEDAKKAVEKMQTDLKEMTARLKKLNISDSNKPFKTNADDTTTADDVSADKGSGPSTEELNIFGIGL